MRFNFLAPKNWGLLTLACAGLLSACGGGNSGDSNANIRLLNATRGYANLALSVNDKSINTDVAYASAGAYASVDTSATTSQIQTTGIGTTVASLAPSLNKGSNYTMIAYGWAGAVHTSMLQEDQELAASGKAKLLVMNLAPDAGTLDFYLSVVGDSLDNEAAVASSIAGGLTSGFNTINSGSYRLRITSAGKKDEVRLDIPSLTLASTGVATLIVTSNEGGMLVNGILLQQKGESSNFLSADARVRVISSFGDGARVTAQLNGGSLMSNAVAPAIGEYQNSKAGAGSLSIHVNGSPMNLAAPSLKAGGDYTLLVWGDSAAPQLTLLSDDNRLAATAGAVKMRLVNAVANLNAGLGLSVDYSAIASNVLPGASSTPSLLSSSVSSLLSVSSGASSSPAYSITDLPLVSNGVYSVFMLGGADKMVGTLRRER
ncbi:DUF4397 domain-containing protein [Roseateles oligotrophus]|uniref:DUF4397 domain-containing protein n=1 Tax=Roseateles oligotrophus TaxID=1769250 RepID=A0ABT2YCU8_9BURK|nr:DUF4397 domain-containing protein [Roseateles oligotrophus]MCV2367881.1 DUF4397 domain-containing protein [Roseateles oligotrophus]